MSVANLTRLKTLINANYGEIKALLSQLYSGYLLEVGWFKSFRVKEALNQDGNPIPWTTYPFIDFINDRLSKELTVFEFGAGSSTLFFSLYVKHVTAVEHNIHWFNKLEGKKPLNVTLVFTDLCKKGEYAGTVNNSKIKYNLIFVDGEERISCIKNAVSSLTDDGVIILDDSERLEYKEGIDYLLNLGFKKIDFWGIAPSILFKKCTTVFYKSDNVLNI